MKMNKIKVSRDYHVPYYAIYSIDANTVYIDSRAPESIQLKDGRIMMVDKYIVVHEVTEKALMDRMGYNYQDAHQMALKTERWAVENDGYPWDEYDEIIQEWILRLDGGYTSVPPDMDLTAMIDEKDDVTLDIIKKLQK